MGTLWEPSNGKMGKSGFWAGSRVRPFDFSFFTSINNLSVLYILFPSKKLMSIVNGSGPKDGGDAVKSLLLIQEVEKCHQVMG